VDQYLSVPIGVGTPRRLTVFGAGDRLISPAEGRRLADAGSGPCYYVVYEEGNHVCFNISYKFRPLTADWTAEKLLA
jgi:hypothetical protein